ncbi:hypothetical protein HDU76_001974 [Blyttiomyces sp. JEL0837]|nr:hypothetical protein HDU76_001974 [Blyttiomyces sp. JEL0837]
MLTSNIYLLTHAFLYPSLATSSSLSTPSTEQPSSIQHWVNRSYGFKRPWAWTSDSTIDNNNSNNENDFFQDDGGDQRSSLPPNALKSQNLTILPPQLQYYNGSILQNIKVQPMYYGEFRLWKEMDQFYQDFVKSEYMSLLSEYDHGNMKVGTGVVRQSLRFKSIPGRKSVKTADIATWSLIERDTIQIDENTYIPIHFPLTFQVTDPSLGTSCKDFCGFHTAFTSTSRNITLVYGIIPNCPSTSSCAVLPPSQHQTLASEFDALTITASHEMVEALLDPKPPFGWFDRSQSLQVGGEVCDLCPTGNPPARMVMSPGKSYAVEAFWSNRVKSCTYPRSG